MLRRLLILTLALALLPMCHAEDFLSSLDNPNVPPTEVIVTEGENIRVTAAYDAATNRTLYTAQLTNDPSLTAWDLLFSFYVHLDPACESPLSSLDILGLESYRRQVPPEQLQAAAETLASIQTAGEAHLWTESDPWPQPLQDTYWRLHAEYLDACAQEFPACAQAIVDYCNQMLAGSRGAFDMSAEAIAQDEGLRIAYAMQQWGYATADGTILTGRRSGRIWQLTGEKPTLQDFVNELNLAYDGDLGKCWAIETTGTHTPTLPSVEEAFMNAYLAEAQGYVASIEGIQIIDDTTLEIALEGINLHEASTLFGQPTLSLNQQGDTQQWKPDEGMFGHPFGDISAIDPTDGIILLQPTEEVTF